MIRLQVYLAGALIFALLVAILAIQNSTGVDIRFLIWDFKKISLVLIILGSATVGALSMLLLGLVKQIRAVIRIRELSIENHKLITELAKVNAEKENGAAEQTEAAPDQAK